MHTRPAALAIRISLASPAQIRAWSHGEVTTPATIHYLTGTPEPGGLCCERIFGPTRDWQCACGKYKRARMPGFRCDKCGVEVGQESLRRERMGHIELAAPVAHPWYARGTPSILARLLGLSRRQLLAVLAYTTSVVTSIDEVARAQVLAHLDGPHETDLRTLLGGLVVGNVLEEAQCRALTRLSEQVCCVGTGATAVRECLRSLDLDALAGLLRARSQQGGEQQRAVSKRLQVVEAFRTSGLDPAWMILEVIPVLPPALRPLVSLSSGKLASSDLNALYERVLCRNERVKRFIELDAPVIMLNNERRLLQEACNALFDNGHRSRPVSDSRGRPLKSLTEVLSGKQGRFRRNLLGKRVDYSGRSVICPTLDLSLSQCELPTTICLELFKPFLIRKLLERDLAPTARAAKRMVERDRGDPIFWDLLEEVMREKVVLLNRAPTLHRLSIQAFEAVRVEGSAIRLHPLVCSAFNADFDGDQMAVHLPLSDEAQAEARALLLSTRNLRSAATGEPSISLSQEIALGLFYLTQDRPSGRRPGRVFADACEATLALEHGVIDLHTPLVVRIPDLLIYDAPEHAGARPAHGRIETTAGRLIFNEALPQGLRFRNYAMTKECLKHLVATCLRICDEAETALMADRLKTLGFHYATRSGTSFALSDIAVPQEKSVILAQADAEAEVLEDLHRSGMITAEERDRQLIELWTKTTEDISARLSTTLDPWGSLATIIQSGATKAKFQQIRQLSGIRGLMASPSGRIIPIPVRGNYLEGLRVWEIFTAASGARKGFMDRSLNTARSGYLTRRLVETAGEVWITMLDCDTGESLPITEEESRAMGLPTMRSRLLGRVLAEPVPEAGQPRGILLTEAAVDRLLEARISAVRVRSPLMCAAPTGLCQSCYGSDLATGELVRPGTAVGIIAAQSVGEPGTQLTMRTFHAGGIAGAQGDITQGLPRVEELFGARPPKNRAILSEIEGSVHLETTEQGDHLLRVVSPDGQTAWSAVIEQGRAVLVTPGEHVTAGMPLSAGAKSPQDLLRLQGREATARYLVSEVQQVYRGTGVYLHDKHLECIVRQMLRYVLVDDPGDTQLMAGVIVDRFAYAESTSRVLAQGGRPALAHAIVLGLTRVALQTDSWIAAASFQETSRVLAIAAISGQQDDLVGFKERIVVGRRIPSSGERWDEESEAILRPPHLPGLRGSSGQERERERL